MRKCHLLCLLALAGCHTAPAHPPDAGPPRPEAIRLFGHEVPPDKESVTTEVLAHVSPDMDYGQARSILETSGFTCRGVHDVSQLWSSLIPPEVISEVIHSSFWQQHTMPKPLYCLIRKDELSRWGREYKTVLVLLYPDKAKQRVESILVFVGTGQNPKRAFFDEHAELQEPVGQPVDDAQRQMQAAGFKCSRETDTVGAPFLLCRYYDEWAIGGKVIHINLFYDDSGIIRDSQVVLEREWFEKERCMLPAADDPAGRFIGKSALFPLREACLLTAEGAAVGAGLLLIGLFPPPWR